MPKRCPVQAAIETHFVGYRKSQVKTIAALVLGLLASRRLGEAAIARCMDCATTVRHCIKRIWRYASNDRIDVGTATEGMVRWVCHARTKDPIMIALDWTALDSYQLLAAVTGVSGRAVPLAWTVVTQSAFDKRRKSRNDIEEQLILRLQRALGNRPWILVADRGFARADLFAKLSQWGISYVIRACGNTWVRTRRHSGILDNIVRRPRRSVRYDEVLYQKRRQVPVALVVTHREPAPEPWYLVTNIEGTKRVVDYYRMRMWIEESFRDAKSQFQLKKLWVARAERMERMFLLVAIAILLAILASLDHCRRNGPVDPQFTTKRSGRTMSLVFMGLELIKRQGFPPRLSRLRLSALIQFAQLHL